MHLHGLSFLLFFHSVVAESIQNDLMSFKTLPDVWALKYNVHIHDRARITPGYWFVAPYLQIDPETPTNLFDPYQVGPYIYDGDGMLIWAGSRMFENRNVFDFKVVNSLGETPFLSLVSQHSFDARVDDDNGHGVILNNEYDIHASIPMRHDLGAFDIHEFNILDDGKTALATFYKQHDIDLAEFNRPEEIASILSGGYAQINLASQEVEYSWDCWPQIPLIESTHINPMTAPERKPGWDYVHINSVDKNDAGDYIISLRFTNSIYLISGQDGSIMWRMGGAGHATDFEQDFTFSKQHDIKFLESNGTRHVVSFLNNGSDEESNDEDVSCAFIIEIETGTEPMTARVLRRYNRPDNDLTRLRGNAQVLPNNHMFVGWSQKGYISEHSVEGDVLMTAEFESDRFSTYRAYKFPFVGRPSAPPDLVANVWGTDESHMLTTVYVSWNGATDVASWNFYARAQESGTPVFVGSTNKTDFESMHILSGYLDFITADALDAQGNVLRTSEIQRTATPNWDPAWYRGETDPHPDDPSITYADGEPQTPSLRGYDEASFEDAQASASKALEIATETYNVVATIGSLVAFIVVACVLCAVVVGYGILRDRRRNKTYTEVPSDEQASFMK
ncbi:hypothetical protein N7510_003398 [Penicillium lagena]|uniref:uncharacterized protein n=1 Tax=Penicillium lagena TaxID=94218 RepID=UPI002540FF63|nr:uncharacterized protein N7510_003398 [Penicillium lagena]KAJ5619414.1 hypothetical protein N7510_003398 [Penicillium lagena]